ncbi:hypothetical protein SAMN02910317_01573 [Ruminococcaceae bacterium FB2012]|nr:hypothetical protein SAMN02910317_01573 [Ruminococcaceae bacterium FB2012]
MKKTIRLMALLMIAAIAAICMVSCGAEEKVKGDWTTKTVNGKTPAEYAAATGVPEYTIACNYTVTSDEFKATTMGVDGTEASSSMKVKMKSNGFECYKGDDLVMSVLYNEGDDTLSFGVNSAGGKIEYILKKGTTDLKALKDAAAQPAEGSEQQAAEGGEQQAAEGGEQQAAEGGEQQAAEGGEEAAAE